MTRKTEQDVPQSISPSKHPSTSEQSQDIVDAATEKRILRKLDTRVVPVLWFLFLVSFVDRGNIGNAKIQGMDKELGLQDNQYNIAVMVFTLAYVIFGIPANIIFKRFGPKSLSVMMFIWGLCAIGQGLTQSWAGLVACRFLMGVFEAGFVPGCAYLIGSYYKKDEFLRRYTVFFSAAIISGAFNGLFASLLAMASGAGGYAGWRWIFLVEGIITCAVAFATWFLIIGFPEKSKLFIGHERDVLLERLKRDGGQVIHDRLSKHVFEALYDWKIWFAMLMYMGAEENASSVVAFQPTILKGLGYSSTQAQVHSIPIYCVAFVTSLLCAWLSEMLAQRYLFAMFGAALTFAGLGVELAQPENVAARYAGMFLLTTGCYVTMPIAVVWSAINTGKGYKRTVAFGMVIAVGNCGALISSNVFLDGEAPVYRTGFSVGLGMEGLCVVCATTLYVYMRWTNAQRDRRQVESPVVETEDMTGEKHPDFRYQL